VKPQNISTGPRTAQGKQRSSLNALRHGLTGQTVVIPSDDHHVYRNFCRDFFAEYQPDTPTERQLVQTIADCSWRLNRLRAQEQTLLSLAIVEQEDHANTADNRALAACASGLAFEKHSKTLSNLTLYEQRISRQFERALKLLKETQAERKAGQERQMALAASLKSAHDALQANQPQPVAYDSANDQFVFSNASIDAWIARRKRYDHALQSGKQREKSVAA
jgi:hypothetical protein